MHCPALRDHSVSISGGGNGSTRSSLLTDQFSLDILAQPSAVASQTSAG